MSIYDLRDYVISSYRGGEHSVVCPVCEGGRGRERSFNVFEVDDNVLGYKCHRSSCGAAGRVLLVGERRGNVAKPTKSGALYLVPATDEDAAEYTAQFGLTDPAVAIYKDKRWFVATLRKHDGGKYGWQRRIIDKTQLGSEERKAYTHKDEKYPLAFYRNSAYNRRLIVVEDPWSAMRIEALPSLDADAAAICGGDWTEVMAREVAGKYEKVVLALDRDAQAKAVKQALQHRHIQQVRVVVPRVDIKNMDDEEIIDTLGG